ncbi:MAG: choice-of-anchor D domain-containing protein [Pseudomonadota bacterium]
MPQIKVSKIIPYSLLCILLFFSRSAQSLPHPIVEVKFHYNGVDHLMDIELFDDTTPLTVANYLDYVTTLDTSGIPKFDGTFVNRNIPNFVLQMGGFTFRPPNPLVDALISPTVVGSVGLSPVVDGPLSPVVNEFNLSNTRGTIAMAKVGAQFVEGGSCVAVGPGCTLAAGTGPDSATKEWFINLSDNTFLDSSNGGFTVFGRIIDSGILIADEISTFPDRPFAGLVLGPAFTNLPVVNYDTAALPAVLQDNLVMITSITAGIIRPVLRFTPENANFGLDVINDGSNPQTTITVKNTGNEALKISSVDIANLLPPFTLISEDCSSKITLDPIATNPSSTCTIIIVYTPTTIGTHAGKITVAYTNVSASKSYSTTLSITGEGVPQPSVLNVSPPAIVFGDTSRNSTSIESTVTIQNKGGSLLNFNSISTTGINSSDFIITNNTCIVPLTISQTCTINITFNPTVAGTRTAALSIQSDGGNTDITLSGLSTIPIISVDTPFTITAQVGDSATKFLPVTNTGTETLNINNIVISGSGATLFSQTNNCPGTNNSPIADSPLTPGGTCNILIKFSPVTNGALNAILTIESTDPDTPSINVALAGVLGQATISVNTTFDVGTSQVNGTTSTKELKVTNNGSTPLLITNILGLNNTGFSQTNTCSDSKNRTAANATCSIFITFNADSFGQKIVSMTIESNDPTTPSINVTLTGFGDTDLDGVPGDIEAASPNSGDGNNDAIPDNTQDNVATLLAANSKYITFITDKTILVKKATSFVDVRLLNTAPADGQPTDANFNYGLYSYSIILPQGVVGDGMNIGILLPAGEQPEKFYKFGPTKDNTSPHWYDFSYDAASLTGAQFIGDVSLQSPSGSGLKRNFITVSYIDGQRGDDDLLANGIILNNKAGLSFVKTNSSSSSGSGSLSYLSLLILIISNLFRRSFFSVKILKK